MLGRKVVLVAMLVCVVVGPAVVLSDTEPAWSAAWLQYVVAGAVGLFFLATACLYGAMCRSGDLSRAEERYYR